jgi:hypothetical protein
MRDRVLSSTQVMLTLQSLARRLFLPPATLSWREQVEGVAVARGQLVERRSSVGRCA